MSSDDHNEQLNLLQTITLEVAAATDLSSALEIVLGRVCEKTGWVIGQAWLPNKEEAVLNFVSGWYCGDGELKPFKAVSEKSHFEPGIGLPGRVWKSKQPAWVENVTNDPNFPRAAAARTAGLKTGVGIPILARSKVIAVLEFFMRESRSQWADRWITSSRGLGTLTILWTTSCSRTTDATRTRAVHSPRQPT